MPPLLSLVEKYGANTLSLRSGGTPGPVVLDDEDGAVAGLAERRWVTETVAVLALADRVARVLDAGSARPG